MIIVGLPLSGIRTSSTQTIRSSIVIVGCYLQNRSLQVHHLNLLRYLEMLKSAEFRDDLDVVSTVHTPKGFS